MDKSLSPSDNLEKINLNMTWNSNHTQEEILAQRAVECIERLKSTPLAADNATTHCPGTWDGWSCVPDTAAGSLIYIPCPDFIFGFDPTRSGHKYCEPNGEWYKHPETNRTWSNYTTCVNADEFQYHKQANLVYETGYAISLLAILLALAILFYFRSLKCARITIHMNLFASFAANNLLWLVYYRLVHGEPELFAGSQTECVVLHLVMNYFLVTNYAWMLCEGFYLHTVLVSAFISEQRLVRWLTAFGWSTPALLIIVYGLARGFSGDAEHVSACWGNEAPHMYVLIVPVVVSIFLNLLFVFNIVRVLLLKLKAPLGPQAVGGQSRNILQAFRATAFLVPLLGLQFLLMPFKPAQGHSWERAYGLVAAFVTSFQGFCVATLFCFCNGEVIAQVKRKWSTVFYSNRPRSNSYTATQVSCVRFGPPGPGEEKV